LASKKQSIPFKLRQEWYTKNWVVFAKIPFAGPKQEIEYLGRYTHKIAISNHRIQSISNGKVTFKYKDYADQGKQKIMSLDTNEFLRRFCMHILPPGFRKIRHYGFLASRGKSKLKVYQYQVGILPPPKESKPKTQNNWKEISQTRLNYDPDSCPCCKTGRMITLFAFGANAPPTTLQTIKQLTAQH
jgi:hypothetical protein